MSQQQTLARDKSLVLAHPPQGGLLEGFSCGLISLASYAAKHMPGVPLQVMDLGRVAVAELGQAISTGLGDCRDRLFVGITTTTASYQAALEVARHFKILRPDCVVMMGGHHASAQDDIILKHHSDVDFVIRGEGERALVELVERYPSTASVPSLSFCVGGAIQRNPPAMLLDQHSLDEIEPMFQGWGLKSASGKFDHTTYISARGCPLRCAFCSVANEKIRAKSVEAVVRDLRSLVGRTGYRRIAIEDNFFAHSPQRTLELCAALEKLQQEMPFQWDCQTRVESCQRRDVMEAMERAGCEAVYLGVEAFDGEHLFYLKKTSSPGTYVRTLRNQVVPWLLNSRIKCYINLQLGLPAECASHRQNTLRHLAELGGLAKQCAREITIFPQLHVVYPGTRHFHEAITEGRFGPDGDSVFERFTSWEARQQPVLRWLGEHFAHGTGGIPEGILRTDALRQGEFEVDSRSIIEIVNYLDDMAKLPGVKVFSYGRYLTSLEHSSLENGLAMPFAMSRT